MTAPEDSCDDTAVTPAAALELTDWRRCVARLYEQVRAEPLPELAHHLWTAGRDELFRGHPQSPLAVDDPLRDTGLPYWPYDPALRVESEVRAVGDADRVSIHTGRGGVTVLEQIGLVTLPDPLDAEIAVWWLPQYAGGVFLPLRDGSAGHGSYGGGRYLLDTAKGADLGGPPGRIVIDLNFLYHPSCRYDPRWVCPLAPPANRIGAAVHAGERMA